MLLQTLAWGLKQNNNRLAITATYGQIHMYVGLANLFQEQIW